VFHVITFHFLPLRRGRFREREISREMFLVYCFLFLDKDYHYVYGVQGWNNGR